MWVKIKSRKINNEILEVPYSAYLNTYSKKGYIIVEDKIIKDKYESDDNYFLNNILYLDLDFLFLNIVCL